MSLMDAELEQLYRQSWERLNEAIPTGCGMSNPLLATVPKAYEESKVRLLVIGQETHGWWGAWDDVPQNDPIAQLRLNYSQFERGRHHNSPFFQAASKLQTYLNPDSDPFGFMWLNLYICDQNKRLPQEPIAEQVRQVSLLREEIRILKPDAVIFFAGPAYNYAITHGSFFPDARFDTASKLWSKVHSSALPAKTARTYHPKYLRLSKQFGVLTEIADWLQENDSNGIAPRADRFVDDGLDFITIVK